MKKQAVVIIATASDVPVQLFLPVCERRWLALLHSSSPTFAISPRVQ